MGQEATIERLREFLRSLSPSATARLRAEYARVLTQHNDPVAAFVLRELRDGDVQDDLAPPLVPSAQPPGLSLGLDIQALVLKPLDPFLDDRGERDPAVIGQIRRVSLEPFWRWLARDVMPEEVASLETTLASAKSPGVADQAVRRFQLAVADAVGMFLKGSPDTTRHRLAMHVGGPYVLDDMGPIADILRSHDQLVALIARLPETIRAVADSHLTSLKMLFAAPEFQRPGILPFALSLVMRRLDHPWQIVRLAVAMAETDDATRVAANPFGVAVNLILDRLRQLSTQLQSEVRRGRFDDSAPLLKGLHDALRGLRTELDIRKDSPWGKQLAALRIEVSDLLESEIESVPGRVRRLLRHRPEKEIPASGTLDRSDVAETEALIDFVATCRNFANELAINEVTSRSFSELRSYIETATKALIEGLRAGDGKSLRFRQAQADAAIRFCAVIFGSDYAALMKKAVDVALSDERPAREGQARPA